MPSFEEEAFLLELLLADKEDDAETNHNSKLGTMICLSKGLKTQRAGINNSMTYLVVSLLRRVVRQTLTRGCTGKARTRVGRALERNARQSASRKPL